MCHLHLHPVKAIFTSILNGLGPPDCMASTAPTAKVSMILTPPAWLTGSRPGSDPRQPPQLRKRGRITGIASHLNCVPDTTCHIEWSAGDYGTAIADITGREGRSRSRKVK